jgi:hypothetical protein
MLSIISRPSCSAISLWLNSFVEFCGELSGFVEFVSVGELLVSDFIARPSEPAGVSLYSPALLGRTDALSPHGLILGRVSLSSTADSLEGSSFMPRFYTGRNTG